ncbi:hypothetical protein [Butyrivibrio sp. MC2013]|uniref:hypothetical protein n=1 Tax=Butyrivibrio sp. MC2013 TaxID=1280686 RepID=UPI000422B498|nr:hypothetical protein [Butyrivibrio sp. MC2013]
MIKIRKIIILLISMIACWSLLVAADWFEIKLRSVDEKDNRLVNLGSILGGAEKFDADRIPAPIDDTDEGSEDDSSQDVTDNNLQIKPDPHDKELTISIRAKEIRINGRVVSEGDFEPRFGAIYDGSQSVILEDDYADYQIYSMIMRSLNDKKIRIREKRSADSDIRN